MLPIPTANADADLHLLVLGASLESALFLSPSSGPWKIKVRALRRLINMALTALCMSLYGLMLLATLWIAYFGSTANAKISGAAADSQQQSNITQWLAYANLITVTDVLGAITTFITWQTLAHHMCLRVHKGTHSLHRPPIPPPSLHHNGPVCPDSSHQRLGAQRAQPPATAPARAHASVNNDNAGLLGTRTPGQGSSTPSHGNSREFPCHVPEEPPISETEGGPTTDTPEDASDPKSMIPKYGKLLASTASISDKMLRGLYLIDTGTQISLVCNTTNLTELTELPHPVAWGGAPARAPQPATHKGRLTMSIVANDNRTYPISIPGVFYCATARLNALSTSDLKGAGISFKIDMDAPSESAVSFISDAGKRKLYGSKHCRSCPLSTSCHNRSPCQTVASTWSNATTLGKLPPADYTHLIFDHAPQQVLQRLAQRTVGLVEKNMKFCNMSGKCHTCMETQMRIPDQNDTSLPEQVEACHDLWCIDLLDFPNAPSHDGNKHCLLIIDALSSYRVALFAPTKDGLVGQLGLYLQWHRNYTGRSPKFFQNDGAGELVGEPMAQLRNKYGIRLRVSEPYDPRPNGRAEKSVDMACKCLRSTLHHSGVSCKFWTHAVSY